MGRLLAIAAALACAHGPRPIEPDRWHELQTEHFVLRTDLSAEDARRVAVDLEETRAALLAVGWRSGNPRPGRTQVIELADDAELQEYAVKGIEGFVADDAFGEPIVVVSGSQDPKEQRFLKHELSHLITNDFLVRNPRWVTEGIACYLETLRFDRRRGVVVVGEPSGDRLQYLRYRPVASYGAVMQTGHEAETMSAEEGWAFETGAWLLVHWLVDEHGKQFDEMLAHLAKGEDPSYAFASAFGSITEATIEAGIAAWMKAGKVRISEAPAPKWQGAIAERRIARADVYAVLADLMRLSPGHVYTADRDTRKRALVDLALQEDPGNPLALNLVDASDAAAATAAHPDDWRAWLLYASRHRLDLEATRKAASLAPDNATVLAALGVAEGNAGKRQEALEHAARAVEIAPGRSGLLVAYAGVLADSGRCEDARSYAQRGIDVLPDGASGAAVTALKKIQGLIEDHCNKLAESRTVERRILGTPKGCDPAGPAFPRRAAVRGPVVAEFVVAPDGTVRDVSVKGDASPGALAAVKTYVQSCRYDPVETNGRRTETHWHVEFNPRK